MDIPHLLHVAYNSPAANTVRVCVQLEDVTLSCVCDICKPFRRPAVLGCRLGASKEEARIGLSDELLQAYSVFLVDGYCAVFLLAVSPATSLGSGHVVWSCFFGGDLDHPSFGVVCECSET